MKIFKALTTAATAAVVCTVMFPLSASAQETPKLSDPEIASVAVTANQIDVNYGKIALKQTKNADIRQFAQTMVTDHTAIIAQAVALATKLGVTPKDNAVTQQLLAGEKKTTRLLHAKKGKAFDKAYIDNEVAYHEAVVSTVQNVLIPQSQNQELKQLLQKVMPLLNEHLDHAKMVQSKFQK
ncbi:MAG TPA: DUF4142 domain-containing protein [Chitinophagaceae bacterium]